MREAGKWRLGATQWGEAASLRGRRAGTSSEKASAALGAHVPVPQAEEIQICTKLIIMCIFLRV